MNTDLEERLAESMRRTAGGMELSGDVLNRATRRHSRRRIVGAGIGVAGIAGILAIGLSAIPTGGNDSPEKRVVQAQPASLRLANAAVASDNISYKMRLIIGTVTYEGAFDPKTATGYCRSPREDSVMTEILVNGTKYVGGERPQGPLPADKGPGETYGRYGQYPGKFDRLTLYAEPGDSVLSAASPDPAALFRALKAANATVTENPDGSLHFEYAAQSTHGSTATSGDVILNGDGRIAKVTMSIKWQSTAKGRLDTGTVNATLELSDYGVEVKAERPKDVVPFR